jgi:hypothetical protein
MAAQLVGCESASTRTRRKHRIVMERLTENNGRYPREFGRAAPTPTIVQAVEEAIVQGMVEIGDW